MSNTTQIAKDSSTETTLSLHTELVNIIKNLPSLTNDLSLELIKFFGSNDITVIENYNAYYDLENLGIYQIAALNSRLRWILCFAKIARRQLAHA